MLEALEQNFKRFQGWLNKIGRASCRERVFQRV